LSSNYICKKDKETNVLENWLKLTQFFPLTNLIHNPKPKKLEISCHGKNFMEDDRYNIALDVIICKSSHFFNEVGRVFAPFIY
jgi:hypothetical protein